MSVLGHMVLMLCLHQLPCCCQGAGRRDHRPGGDYGRDDRFRGREREPPREREREPLRSPRPCLGVSAVRLVLPALAMTMTTTASLSVAARRHINDVAGMTSFAVVKGIALATATTTIMIVAGEAAW